MTILGPQNPGGQQRRFASAVFALLTAGILVGVVAQEMRSRGWFDRPSETLQKAQQALKHGDDQVALSLFAVLANKNNAVAEYWLGNMTELGLPGPRAPAKTIDLYKKAADQSVVMASLRLGENYLHGNLVLPDFGLAKSSLQRAAYQGSTRAAKLPGRMSGSALRTAVDPREAYVWSEVAMLEIDELAKRERDASLHALKPSDQQAALTTPHDILQKIQDRTAPSPDLSRAT